MEYQFADIESIRPYTPFIYNPEPREWSALDRIDWSKPITIEVGCGKGSWVTEQAQKNTNRVYIGIEKTNNKSKTFINKANSLKLPNLTALQADANALIHHKVPHQSVDELYFFYPNPTPKKRQANQRFFVGSSFHVFDKCLKANGKIYLASNIKEYVWEAKQFLEKVWEYDVHHFGKISQQIIPRTEFEKKYLANGDPLFELKARKST